MLDVIYWAIVAMVVAAGAAGVVVGAGIRGVLDRTRREYGESVRGHWLDDSFGDIEAGRR